MKREPMGAHWDASGYSKLYQLYRRVQMVAVKLNRRRKLRWVPTKRYISELYAIANQLKVLDGEYNRQRRKAPRR
jgi:hypothetical protein